MVEKPSRSDLRSDSYGQNEEQELLTVLGYDLNGRERTAQLQLDLIAAAVAQGIQQILMIETDGDTRQKMISLFSELGYSAYMLQDGKEVELNPASDKDIIFRYQQDK